MAFGFLYTSRDEIVDFLAGFDINVEWEQGAFTSIHGPFRERSSKGIQTFEINWI